MAARTAVGVTIGAAFVAAVIWAALSATAVECEICVQYKGRQACSTARAADLQQADMQAHSGACSQVTSGVTETLECARIAPSAKRCSEYSRPDRPARRETPKGSPGSPSGAPDGRKRCSATLHAFAGGGPHPRIAPVDREIVSGPVQRRLESSAKAIRKDGSTACRDRTATNPRDERRTRRTRWLSTKPYARKSPT